MFGRGSTFTSWVLLMLAGVVFLVMAVPSVPAWGNPPSTINIRGQLLNASGQALSGARDFRVQFYDAAADGTALGTAITGTASVSLEGIFNIEVALPASVLAAAEAWYELAISSTATPAALSASDTFPNRVKVVSVPFALESSEADHVDVAGIGSGTVLDAEFEFLSGVTSNIQDQFDAKADIADVYSKTEVDSALVLKADASALGTESTARADADTALQANITAESTARADADTALQANITAEATARAGADTTLQADMLSETTARTNADTTLQSSVSSEATTRDDMDTLVQARISYEALLRTESDSKKVEKTGDTMTGALTVNDSYVGIGQATAPGTVTDKLYNAGGTLKWNGNPAYRFPWTTVTAATQMAGNNGYIANGANLITLTLPASASLNVGDTVRVNGIGTGSWKIAQNDSQQILTNTLRLLDYSGTWTARDSSRYWYGVASSADGTKLVACHYSGYIYTSTDSGVTWTARDSARDWSDVASSVDGTKLVACHKAGYIYTSTDSGANWTAHTGPGTGNWCSVASSADGTKLAATPSSGYVYTSADSGTTWTAQTGSGSRYWMDVTSSADGTKLAACVYSGYVYTSTDSGATWTTQTGSGSRGWYTVAFSADGAKLAACAYSDYVYTSTDSGATWTAQTGSGSRGWCFLASSADCTKLLAGVYSGCLYTSTDSGMTWTVHDSARNWHAGAFSSDGTKIVAVAQGSNIFTYSAFLSNRTATTTGTAGYIDGGQNTAVELQFIGNDTFVPISYVGSLDAN